jgi:radical SAM superfamily enzyme YgiQ (UPF0313 family)
MLTDADTDIEPVSYVEVFLKASIWACSRGCDFCLIGDRRAVWRRAILQNMLVKGSLLIRKFFMDALFHSGNGFPLRMATHLSRLPLRR